MCGRVALALQVLAHPNQILDVIFERLNNVLLISNDGDHFVKVLDRIFTESHEISTSLAKTQRPRRFAHPWTWTVHPASRTAPMLVCSAIFLICDDTLE